MKKLMLVLLSAITGSVLTALFLGLPLTVRAGGGAPTCSATSGDVNGDGQLDLADAVTILGHLFLGSPTELTPRCETRSSSGLPDTGQAECYALLEGVWGRFPCAEANCTGQDAQYGTGCLSEGRFVDNWNGTVNDTCTGLMWQKDAADVNGDGQSTGEDRRDWCDSLAYCENLIFAGHDDWRLPNVRELQSLVDYSLLYPAIDGVFGSSSSWYWYWSSTSVAGLAAHSWYVDFDSGFVFHDGKTFNFNVRAVRGGP